MKQHLLSSRLLMLALVALVSQFMLATTASATRIYYANPYFWEKPYVYVYDGDANNGIMDDGKTTVWGNGTVWYTIDEGIDHLLMFHPREGVADGAIFTAQNGKFSYTTGFKKMTAAGIKRNEYWGTAVSSGFYGESDNYGKSQDTYVSEAKSGSGFKSLTTKGSLYQITIPLTELGIDKSYIESHGIKVMTFSTFGTSMMDALPWCCNLIDKASEAYSQDDSTSAEKEDTDDYNVPLACVGKIWSVK